MVLHLSLNHSNMVLYVNVDLSELSVRGICNSDEACDTCSHVDKFFEG